MTNKNMSHEEVYNLLQKYNTLSGLLQSQGSISVNRMLAFAIGLEEATLYCELLSKKIYYREDNKLQPDQTFYFRAIDIYYATSLTERKQKRILENLEKLDLITITKKGVPLRRYFYVNEDIKVIATLLKEGEEIRRKTIEKIKESHIKKQEERRQKNDSKPLFFNCSDKTLEHSSDKTSEQLKIPCSDKTSEHSSDKMLEHSSDEMLEHSSDKTSVHNNTNNNTNKNNTKNNTKNILDTKIPTLENIQNFLREKFSDLACNTWFNEDKTEVTCKDNECTIFIDSKKYKFIHDTVNIRYIDFIKKEFDDFTIRLRG